MLSMKKVSAVQNMDDLKALGIGNIICDISGRGGGLGFYRADVAKAAGVSEELLPGKFGAYCNYLGGGVRGAICVSGFAAVLDNNPEKNVKKSLLLKALQEACVRVYKNLEDEAGMNAEVDADGEINWEAKAANASRAAGIESAY